MSRIFAAASVLLLALGWLVGPARAAPPLPAELEPWVPWVRAGLPDLDCPVLQTVPVCVWPGAVELDVGADGASFRYAVHVDRAALVRLPGGPGLWPQGLTDGGLPVPVLEQEGRPVAQLGVGDHALAGRLTWASRPPTLPLPQEVGVVRARVDGLEMPNPVVEADGSLRLGAAAEAAAADRLEIEVARRIQDGVPLRITTAITLRVAGASRELALGAIGLAGARPVQLDGQLPARLDPDQGLVVQLRPGTFTLTLEAVLPDAVDQIAVPAAPTAAWPSREVWVVVPNEGLRAAVFGGLVAVDPSRVTLPAGWEGGSTYLAPAGGALTVEVLRRGDPKPLPNQLKVYRDAWLDLDGGGFTFRDEIEGRAHQGWRLSAAPPLQPGRITLHDEGQVITLHEGMAGVELRAEAVKAKAFSRAPREATLDALGWQLSAETLRLRLHLPPGWSLLAAIGADTETGSVLAQVSTGWVCLVIGLVGLVGRSWGLRVGLLAAAVFVLTGLWEEGPRLLWAPLVGIALLLRSGWRPSGIIVWMGLGGLSAILALAALTALLSVGAESIGSVDSSYSDDVYLGGRESARNKGDDAYDAKVRWQDPAAVVQTGPGVPTWSASTVDLQWEGPVTGPRPLRLLLLPPWFTTLWALFCGVGAIGLLVQLFPLRLRALLPTAGLFALLFASRAQAAPSPELLTELRSRVEAPAPCAPNCVSVPQALLRLDGEDLRIIAQVDAGDEGAWALPGPAAAWSPAEVLVDGRQVVAARRGPDGLIRLRLSPGVHAVAARGPLPRVDALTLQWEQPPQRLVVEGEGWTAVGLRADGRVDSSLQLLRQTSTTVATSATLAPWLEVERSLELGLPWRVTTTVRRSGPGTAPVNARVPLLPGESVTDAAVSVVDGAALIALSASSPELRWSSTLAEAPSLRLIAPKDVPWTERWRVFCATLFRCEITAGPAPISHVQEGRWEPVFLPLPGEAVEIAVARLAPAEGTALTVRSLRHEAGRTSDVVEIAVLASQGGRLTLHLPEAATLRGVSTDGRPLPGVVEAGALTLPVRPGEQTFRVEWAAPAATGLLRPLGALRVEAPVVNISQSLDLPTDQSLIAVWGPDWGPSIWGQWGIVLFPAFGLLLHRLNQRLPPRRALPLGVGGWVLLFLGLFALPLPMALFGPVGALWLGWELAQPALHPRRWLAVAGLLAGIGFAALLGLTFGLDLFRSDGPGTGDLSWYVDRIDGTLPAAGAIVVPRALTQALFGLWALWILRTLPTLRRSLTSPPAPPPAPPTEELTPPVRTAPPELAAMRVGRPRPPIEDRLRSPPTAPPADEGPRYDADVFVPSLITEAPELPPPPREPDEGPSPDDLIEADSATFTALSLPPPTPLGPPGDKR